MRPLAAVFWLAVAIGLANLVLARRTGQPIFVAVAAYDLAVMTFADRRLRELERTRPTPQP